MKKAAKSRLLRSGLITSGATLMSRILGMLRDVAIASLLGASLSADVYFFANRIPNFFRRLFAEGAFAQAFIPVLTGVKEQGNQQQLKTLIAQAAGTLGLIVFIISALGMLLSPAVTAIFGWGWYQAFLDNTADAQKFTEASMLLRLTFPYLFFITLTALAGSVLNVCGRFALPALTPCILNLTLIAAALWIAPQAEDKNLVLAAAMTAGGVIQLLIQIPALWRLKLLDLPRWAWNKPEVRQIRHLMIPALIGVSASQINLLVNTILASFLATGAISYLYYSDRLLEFPIGIFAVAISTVILPALARVKVQHNEAAFKATFDWGVRLVLLLGIPSMCGIAALREPILRVLFMRGEFTALQVNMSAASLLASVSGLCAIMLVRVLVQGFAAVQDTKTPVRCAVIAIIANIIFNLMLIAPLGYIGLALSTALAAFVNAGQLLFLLHKRKLYTISKTTIMMALKALIAALCMAAGLRYLMPEFNAWVSMSTLMSIFNLSLCILGGALFFVAFMYVMGFRMRYIRR